MLSKVFRAIIMGAPGSGKGTISAKILNDFRLHYLSVGDLLRDHISKRSEVGLEAEGYLKDGKLVPDLVVNKLVLQELTQHYTDQSFLMDGYPRTLAQANELWSRQDLRPHSAINLVVPDDEIIERIKHRWIHLASGRIYHTIYNPPKVEGKDDVTGEPLVQREDDKEHVVMQRLLEYKKQSDVIIDFFRFAIALQKALAMDWLKGREVMRLFNRMSARYSRKDFPEALLDNNFTFLSE